MSTLTPTQVAEIRERITDAARATWRELRPDDKTDLDPATLLAYLQATRAASQQADELLADAVTSARHAGCSWTEIGDAFGVSKQAVQRRFSPRDPHGDTPSQRVLRPVTAFTEMPALEEAGRHGWHSIGFGFAYHRLEHSTCQWEHRREAFPRPGTRRRLESQGWQCIGSVWPWQYYKRPLDEPALPED
jgi:hypothetical protein